MPTLEENIRTWGKTYDWKGEGDEWSEPWGGTEYLWYGTILPRVLSFVPADTILELAPGYGRCTHYLAGLCRTLQLVDLNQNCIEHCRDRFSQYDHIHYAVNDGRSLEAVDDDTVDFIFSWDSLVHCEAEVCESYIAEFARVLHVGGWGFVHHSNLGSYRDPGTGTLPCDNLPWRGETMTAGIFREACAEHGLSCVRQETVNWNSALQNDCFSVFTRPGQGPQPRAHYVENTRFHEEVGRIAGIAELYSFPAEEIRGITPSSSQDPVQDGLSGEGMIDRMRRLSLAFKPGRSGR